MSDIVERLRRTAQFIAANTGAENSLWVGEAADEIDRLRKADAVWRQRYSLLESQIANCHKEMKKLREALLTAAPPS